MHPPIWVLVPEATSCKSLIRVNSVKDADITIPVRYVHSKIRQGAMAGVSVAIAMGENPVMVTLLSAPEASWMLHNGKMNDIAYMASIIIRLNPGWFSVESNHL